MIDRCRCALVAPRAGAGVRLAADARLILTPRACRGTDRSELKGRSSIPSRRSRRDGSWAMRIAPRQFAWVGPRDCPAPAPRRPSARPGLTLSLPSRYDDDVIDGKEPCRIGSSVVSSHFRRGASGHGPSVSRGLLSLAIRAGGRASAVETTLEITLNGRAARGARAADRGRTAAASGRQARARGRRGQPRPGPAAPGTPRPPIAAGRRPGGRHARRRRAPAAASSERRAARRSARTRSAAACSSARASTRRSS